MYPRRMGITERAVRRIREGTSGVLLQSGPDEKWRIDSMECYCHLRNVQDLVADGKTLYERRSGEPFEGLVIPFGAMVEYHPIFAKDHSRLQQLGNTVLPGVFFGYALIAEEIWKGDIFVADIEELEILDASEVHDRRLSQKKCERQGEHFIPDRGCNSNIVWKRLWSPRIHSEAGTTETSEDLMGETQGNSDPTDRNKS